jgi:hypothetical protein
MHAHALPCSPCAPMQARRLRSSQRALPTPAPLTPQAPGASMPGSCGVERAARGCRRTASWGCPLGFHPPTPPIHARRLRSAQLVQPKPAPLTPQAPVACMLSSCGIKRAAPAAAAPLAWAALSASTHPPAHPSPPPALRAARAAHPCSSHNPGTRGIDAGQLRRRACCVRLPPHCLLGQTSLSPTLSPDHPLPALFAERTAQS